MIGFQQPCKSLARTTENNSCFVKERKFEFSLLRYETFVFCLNGEESIDSIGSKRIQSIWLKEIAKDQHKKMLHASYFAEDVSKIVHLSFSFFNS